MKKILALILTIASIATMLVMPVSAEEVKTSLSQDQITLLSYIGVYDAEADLTKTITKAEFANLLSKFAFGLDQNVELYATGDKAADVKSDHMYYTPICALLSSGYISTNKFGSFLPDTALNINTAYEFILRTMGYSETEDFKAGKYARLAAQKDISDGLVGADGEVSYQNAYILIYNMLYTDVSDMMSLVYNHISSNKELLYMQNRLGLYNIKGIVTDDGNYSLYGDTAIKEGQISIDNGTAMLNGTGLGDLVGKNVVGYYRETDKEEYELVCLYERTDKNDSIVLNSQNILKPYTNNTYQYYEDEFSTKVKKVKVKSGATIIYNNKALKLTDTFTQDDFIPENGFVKLYDNNGDGTMDIIRIEDYKEAVATTLDRGNEIFICMKFTNEVINLDDVTYSVYDKYGAEMEYNKIKEGNVISVLKSLDGKTYKFVVSSDTATAEVKAVSKSTPSQRGHLITADGGKYSFSQWLEDHYGTPELGSSYKFAFDAFGRIVDITKVSSSNDWLGGFLVWIQSVSDMGGDYYIKLFNDAGVWELLAPADKVQVIGEDDSFNTYSPSQLATNVTYQGVIRYKLNKEGKVNNIELPKYYGTRPTTPDRLFCLLDTTTEAPNPPIEGDTRKYAKLADYYLYPSGTNVNFGGAAYADSSSKIIVVPTDENLLNTKEYKIGNSAVFEQGVTNPVRVYGTNFRTNKASYVTTSAKAASAKLQRGPKWVQSVRQTTDPQTGEIVYQVETIDKSTNKGKYYVEKDYYETGIFGIAAANPNPIHLAPGDGMYCTFYDGYIVNAAVMYDADQEATDSHGSKVVGMVPGITTTDFTKTNNFCNPFGTTAIGTQNAGSGNASNYNRGEAGIFVGWIYDIDGNFVTITNQNPASGPIDISKTLEEGSVTQSFNYGGSYTLKRPEIGRIKNVVSFSKGALADMKPYTKYGANCSKVILCQVAYEFDSLVIIENN